MNLKDSLAPVVALVVLLGFGVLVGVMLFFMHVDDRAWARSVYVFGSVESLAFGAAGFFFGREIHRERADKAEQRANASKHEADAAKTRAITAETNGKALTKAIKVKAGVDMVSGAVLESMQPRTELIASPINELATLATELFPD